MSNCQCREKRSESGPSPNWLGAFVPGVDMAAQTAVKLPDNVAYVNWEGYQLRVEQSEPWSPLELRMRSRVEAHPAGV